MHLTMRAITMRTLLAAATLSVVAACGSEEPGTPLAISGGETGQTMWYDPDDPEVEPGRYEVTFDNVGVLYHELAVVSPSGEVLAARSVGGAQEAVFDVDLSEPGTYTLTCREPGHTEAGMAGTLSVG